MSEGNQSRTRRAGVNALVGISTQAVGLGLSVATRTIFLWYFTVEYLGLNTLLGTTIGFVGVADLGVQGALLYTLYHPIANGRTDEIKSILRYARKIYRLIALAVFTLGVVVCPLIPLVSDTEIPFAQLAGYYFIVLFGSVFSYLMEDRTLLLLADQRFDIIKIVQFLSNVIRFGLQVFAIAVLHSFALFLLVQTLCTLLANYLAYLYVNRNYPYVKEPAALIESEKRREIGVSLRSMLSYRVGGVILNNTDPMVISALVGTAALGYYANYSLIIGSALLFTELVFTSLTAGVGHAISTGSKATSFKLLKELTLFSAILYGTISLVMLVAIPPVITLWLGDSFVLTNWVLYMAIGNFLSAGLLSAVSVFRGATGVFRDIRYLMFVTAAINLLLSIWFGHLYGIAGVLGATILARLATNAWLEPLLIVRRYLTGRVVEVFFIQLFGIAIVVCGYTLVLIFRSNLSLNPAIDLISMTSMALLFAGLFSWLCWGRSEIGRSIKHRLTHFIPSSTR